MYAFFQITPEVREQLELGDWPDRPVPVREERLDALTIDGELDLDLLCDELESFLADNPEYRENYRELLGKLAYRVGLKWGLDGFPDAAAHYFGLGLRWNPENLSLRSNYAVALHLAGKTDQALGEYLHLIRGEDIGAAPLIWMLAARICYERGEFEAARDLLAACAKLAPTDETFWEFYAEADDLTGGGQVDLADLLSEDDRAELDAFMREEGLLDEENAVEASVPAETTTEPEAAPPAESPEKTSPGPENTAEAEAPETIACPKCGESILADSPFCRFCGAKIEKPEPEKPAASPRFCFQCGTKLENPDASFCFQCGAKL